MRRVPIVLLFLVFLSGCQVVPPVTAGRVFGHRHRPKTVSHCDTRIGVTTDVTATLLIRGDASSADEARFRDDAAEPTDDSGDSESPDANGDPTPNDDDWFTFTDPGDDDHADTSHDGDSEANSKQ